MLNEVIVYHYRSEVSGSDGNTLNMAPFIWRLDSGGGRDKQWRNKKKQGSEITLLFKVCDKNMCRLLI